jgi:4-hydroxybenzoate polyprenyltransferase
LYTIFFLLAAAGITISHYALILISQAEDQPADKKMGLLTPAVKWGLYKTIRISFLLNVIGSILAILALIGIFLLINIWFVYSYSSICIFFLKSRGKGWLNAIAVAVLMDALIYGLFESLLKIELYRGLFFRWLGIQY